MTWEREELERWMEQARLSFTVAIKSDLSPDLWRQHCDWMGLQRNIKIVGIFARLHYRDNKQGYLEMIPQFAAYIIDVLARYKEFQEIAPTISGWLEQY
jgi:aminoglycoside/choline kinase family phosphotransferase